MIVLSAVWSSARPVLYNAILFININLNNAW